MECRRCNLCDEPGDFDTAVDVEKVRSNVLRYRDHEFTVWRCTGCGSLHCLEDIDYQQYYSDYPVHHQTSDMFTRFLFESRLRMLVEGGLSRQHSILDYGCGNGGFVAYLRERGYQAAEGYDPFTTKFSDEAILRRKYDYVVSCDVIEHAPDTLEHLDQMISLVRSGGIVAIGTPNAAELSLKDPIDRVGHLHQPYHRHLLTRMQLERLLEKRSARVLRTTARWYVDTWIPFLNSRFFFRYVEASGGAVDSIFEPIRYSLILKSPRLLWHGFFGRILHPGKDVLVFARVR